MLEGIVGIGGVSNLKTYLLVGGHVWLLVSEARHVWLVLRHDKIGECNIVSFSYSKLGEGLEIKMY